MVGRRTVWTLMVLAAVSARGAAAQSQNLTALQQAVTQAGGRVIVTLKSTSQGAAVRAPGSPPLSSVELDAVQTRLQASFPVQVQAQVPLIGALVATISSADVARLVADPNVQSIEPDVKTYITNAMSHSVARPAGPAARPSRIRADVIPWGVTDVNAPAAWASGLTGAGVKVGIMDTGIDYTHPDLNVVGGYDFTTSSSAPSAYNDTFASCDGHGTHVAGTVAARQNGSGVVGVAPGASLYALKVFTDYGTGCFAFLSAQIFALQWAVTNGLDVVSISIGNSISPSYASAITNANAAGVVVVAAAGNGGGPGVTYPAAAPGAIAVAALDAGNTLAGYSSTGPELWIAAPGSGVESTVPGGGTGFKSGTSMATPHVTGVVALIKQLHPGWSATQIATELRNDAMDIAPAGFDNNTGWGLVRAPVGGAPPPLTIAVSPATRVVSVQQGSSAPTDNATVTLGGTNASTTAWSATKKKAWTTLTTASGTGSGTVAWSRNATGLAVGTYVDTITVSAAGAVGSPSVVFDTLKITAPPIPVTLALSPAARSVSVQQGSSAPADNATVTLAGTNAASTAWTATKKKTWLTLTTASGTGSGSVAWTRSGTGLAVGTYVDTITVTAPGVTGSPKVVYDTLKITAAPIPVTLAVSPGGRAVSVQQGGTAPGDNAAVTLAGTNAASTAWTATKKKAWLTLTTAAGTGSGTVAWSRSATGLAVGTYVDTIAVTAAGATGSPTVVYDTLKITAAPIPVTLAVSPGGRAVSVQQGGTAPSDNAAVTLAGTNAASTAWTATKKKAWLTLTTASGTGSGTVAWSRSGTGLAVGTYVDTITVSAAGATGSPTVVYDTLKITAAPVPVTLAVSPAARSVSVQQGNSAPSDNAAVTLAGTGAGSTAWSATKKKAWLTLTTASGTGSGTVAWSRSATGLAVGTYVDTITVSAAGVSGSPTVVYDTLKITAAPVPVTLAVSPAARSVSVQQGNGAPSDNATVTLSGTGASTTGWTATRKMSWLTLTAASGTGSGTVTWARSTVGLGAGTYVDTITIAAAGVGSPVVVFDTLKITAIPVPLTVTVSPAARSVTAQVGTVVGGDNAAVTLSGTGAVTTAWSATKTKSWLALQTSSGTGSGPLSWSRSTTGLVAGTYVDTITISVAGAIGSPATIYDTLKITAAPVPASMVVSPSSRSVSVQQGSVAPGDNATVSIGGTNAATIPWSATRRSSWLNLASGSGTGSGTLTWSRNASGLGVGTYVDTIKINAIGVVGPPATVYDTLVITAAPIAITMAVSPAARNVSVSMGSGTIGDNAAVTLSGTNAASAAWSATHSNAPWANFVTLSGIGSGYVVWNRNVASLAVGTYVDTIRVTLQTTGQSAMVYDTVRIIAVAVPHTIALEPRGRKSRTLRFEGSPSLVGSDVDSALVQPSVADSITAAGWTAAVSSSRLALFAPSGLMTDFVKWSRVTQPTEPGFYVDTVAVVLQGDSTVRAQFIDSLEVVTVAIPAPDAAVGDLFDHNSLNVDQRDALDRQGNGNGRYDLGDFLAWINRNHIRLSPAAALRMKQATLGGGGRL